jgi:hypothetical protein
MQTEFFKDKEFACRCKCGLNRLDPKLRQILNEGRSIFGAPIIIVSGSRCEPYNVAVKGSKHSAHLVGPDNYTHAADIQVYSDITRADLHRIFTILGIRRFEVSDLHIHVDNATYLPAPLLASVNFKGVIET